MQALHIIQRLRTRMHIICIINYLVINIRCLDAVPVTCISRHKIFDIPKYNILLKYIISKHSDIKKYINLRYHMILNLKMYYII